MPLFELPPLSPCSKLCPRTPSLRPPFSTTQKTKTKSTKLKQEKKNFRILSESKKRIHKPPILPCIEKGQSQKEGRFFFSFLEGFWRNLTDWHLLRTETSVRNYWIAPVHCPNDKLILSVGRSGPTWKKKVLVGRRKRCRFSFGV